MGCCFQLGIGVCRDSTVAKEYLRKCHNDSDTLNYIAFKLFELKRAEDALPFAERAVSIAMHEFATNWDYYPCSCVFDTLAAILDALCRFKEAQTVCTKELELFPEEDDSENKEVALVRLGRACHRLGDKAGAADAWSKALSLVEKHGGKQAEYGESADELRRLIREAGGAE